MMSGAVRCVSAATCVTPDCRYAVWSFYSSQKVLPYHFLFHYSIGNCRWGLGPAASGVGIKCRIVLLILGQFTALIAATWLCPEGGCYTRGLHCTYNMPLFAFQQFLSPCRERRRVYPLTTSRTHTPWCSWPTSVPSLLQGRRRRRPQLRVEPEIHVGTYDTAWHCMSLHDTAWHCMSCGVFHYILCVSI